MCIYIYIYMAALEEIKYITAIKAKHNADPCIKLLCACIRLCTLSHEARARAHCNNLHQAE